ncbi:hypothetical protein HHI36_009955 [Cryptolaemus montrouzieri]|uniref:Uncharacterized protein n=1 Tax=Cryptolaemus montrouzieri TaxID=559131 RepID=A0ABD2MHD2_9CUCU
MRRKKLATLHTKEDYVDVMKDFGTVRSLEKDWALKNRSLDPSMGLFANVILKLSSSCDHDQIEIYETEEEKFENAYYQLKSAMECFVTQSDRLPEQLKLTQIKVNRNEDDIVLLPVSLPSFEDQSSSYQEAPVAESSAICNHSLNKITESTVVLSRVCVKVYDCYGKDYIARALIEMGSQANSITNNMCTRLGFTKKSVEMNVRGINQNAKW